MFCLSRELKLVSTSIGVSMAATPEVSSDHFSLERFRKEGSFERTVYFQISLIGVTAGLNSTTITDCLRFVHLRP